MTLNEEEEALLRRALTEMGLSGDKRWTGAVVIACDFVGIGLEIRGAALAIGLKGEGEEVVEECAVAYGVPLRIHRVIRSASTFSVA